MCLFTSMYWIHIKGQLEIFCIFPHFRFNWTVKAAVLETLALLLAKVEIMLRQFLPQLQTTFLKALNDSNRQVRIKAATAMSFLIKIHTKADPLFSELHLLMKGAEDPAIR